MLLISPALSQPVLEAVAVPGLNDQGRTEYTRYLLVNLPRAFATDGHGVFGWQGGTGTPEQARAKAIERRAVDPGSSS